ncbi:exopolysaccharide biosynthesis protein [Methylorubrum rhodesianum]|uniref:Exopolysaccharide biosynthesis protein n=2 Tax=Methylobacteriaceae TaxID=119045 RepID=A0ABU9Z789_9HYPH|nr:MULTISPECIES: exopolysaccharide biosynthesis protein [Methylorubrum]
MSSAARTSDVLTMLASQESERLTVGDIVAVLRDRAFALLVVLLGLPNCLPMPPPIPLVCGLVLLVIAIQIVAGMSAPWLPRRLLDQSIARATVEKAVSRAVPLLRRLERWSRPRLSVFDGAVGMRGMGVLILALALALIVAPPFFGQIPLGLAVSLIGLGLVERDGFVVLIGLLIGGVGVGISIGFVYTLFASIMGAFAWLSQAIPGLGL